MPFALLIVGLFLIVSAVRGTTTQLGTLVKGDFTGAGNFFYWFLAIVLIGSLGYVDKARPFANAFLGFIMVVLILRKGDPSNPNGGFFTQFTAAFQQAQTATTPAAATTSNTSTPVTSPTQPMTNLVTLPQAPFSLNTMPLSTGGIV